MNILLHVKSGMYVKKIEMRFYQGKHLKALYSDNTEKELLKEEINGR